MKDEAPFEYGCDLSGEPATCWLREFAADDCAGRLEKTHILPKQLLRREGLAEFMWAEAVWRPACRHHHFALDAYRGLNVPRESVPADTERFAEDHGLGWYLERRFGAQGAAA